jgi:hypothetical protein
LLNLRDILTGKRVLAHGGSVYWNAYRHRWVMIAVEIMGSSLLGEVWFAEADAPLGPWVYARKIVTHDDYSFYNPKQHPFFDQDGGRLVFFEGTYTQTFSGNKDPTPRYDYNQVMYQMDLADPRLALPVAVHEVHEDRESSSSLRLVLGRRSADDQPPSEVAFFAPERPGLASIPIVERRGEPGGQVLLAAGDARAIEGSKPDETPLFYVIPADVEKPFAGTAPLYEFRQEAGRGRYYSPVEDPRPGYRRSPRPLGRVWKNPSRLTIW